MIISIIDALNEICEKAKETTCSGEGNCTLKLDGYHNYTILKGERARTDSSEISDYLLFINEEVEELFIIIVEFKSDHVNVGKVARQIENGSTRALQLLKICSKICFNGELKCLENKKIYHIAIAKRWNTTTRKMLKEIKIQIDGEDYWIRTKECNNLLKDMLS